MTPQQQKDNGVTAGRGVPLTLMRLISWRTFANALGDIYVGDVPRRKQRVSRGLGRFIEDLRGDRPAPAMAEVAGLVSSRWYQVEQGQVPPAQTLYEMAKALGATAAQTEEMFRLAQYDEMFDQLSRIGASRTPGVPSTAELGISADPTLSPEAKAKALDYLRMLRETS